MRKATIGLLAIALITGRAAAHPGHGADGGSFRLLHYLTEPVHVGVGVLIVLGIAAGMALVRGKSSRTRLPL